VPQRIAVNYLCDKGPPLHLSNHAAHRGLSGRDAAGQSDGVRVRGRQAGLVGKAVARNEVRPANGEGVRSLNLYWKENILSVREGELVLYVQDVRLWGSVEWRA
jgi:hypothetical protein